MATPELTDEFLTNIIAAHGMWKYRLHEAIESGQSKLSVATVGVDDACPLGRWLYEDVARKSATLERYAEVKALHAEFHRTTASILELAISGQREAARAQLASRSAYRALSEISHRVSDAAAVVGDISENVSAVALAARETVETATSGLATVR